MRVKGVITLLLDGEFDIPALKNSVLTYATDPISAVNIADLGWTNSVPNISNWTVSVGGNLLLDADEKFDATQALLESYAFDKTEFVLIFTAATGQQYVGRGFVSEYRIASADQVTLGFAAAIRGSEDLVFLEDVSGGGATPPSWCPSISQTLHYWQLPHPINGPLWMGTVEGWVKVTHFNAGSTGGSFEIYYDDVLVHYIANFGDSCSAGGPGVDQDTYYYYDPNPFGPFALQFDGFLDYECATPFGENYAVRVYCPGEFEPVT